MKILFLFLFLFLFNFSLQMLFFYERKNSVKNLDIDFGFITFVYRPLKNRYCFCRKVSYCKYLSLVKVLKHIIRSNIRANKQYFSVTFKGLEEDFEECVLILNIFVLCLF